VALTPCGHRSDKNHIYAATCKELKQNLQTLQAVQETLFANRKTKEKNAPRN
jgi:hypothetical protein